MEARSMLHRLRRLTYAATEGAVGSEGIEPVLAKKELLWKMSV
jgi:hypothetical protein